MSVEEQVRNAYDNLFSLAGFSNRPAQRQLSALVADLIHDGTTGAFEAPTGLGKSLAVLIPAIASAVTDGKRIVISTYTNVLAEQYWRKDVPLALSLFDFPKPPKVQLLEGKGRYVCKINLAARAPEVNVKFAPMARQGLESELRESLKLRLPWNQVNAPEACPGRFCSEYSRCYYYNARSAATKAQIVITNHSVVLQDALILRNADSDGSLLGPYDFLIVDEAHDLPSAARSAFEFELKDSSFDQVEGLLGRLLETLSPVAIEAGDPSSLSEAAQEVLNALSSARNLWRDFSAVAQPGILFVSPQGLLENPSLKSQVVGPELQKSASRVGEIFGASLLAFIQRLETAKARWAEKLEDKLGIAVEVSRSYQQILESIANSSLELSMPQGVSVVYVKSERGEVSIKSEVVDVAPILEEILWSKRTSCSLSATLALDGNLEFYKNLSGVPSVVEEILPSPFDYRTQAAVYLPSTDKIPDPSEMRKQNRIEVYFDAVARELETIITALQGRTLALFASKKEMDEVSQRMRLPEHLPLLVQGAGSSTLISEQFRKDHKTSLFALRSFWTGFDAPGETLSCTVIVRIPFEVPVDPPARVRSSYLVSQGRDPFQEYTLTQAKMMMRQGAGRLIRTMDDKGILAILDPRLRSKRYGEDILANLPSNMNVFNDIYEAMASVDLK